MTDSIHDNEFVDRYLNVNETSYDVASLFNLLDRQDFKFLRWVEPALNTCAKSRMPRRSSMSWCATC